MYVSVTDQYKYVLQLRISVGEYKIFLFIFIYRFGCPSELCVIAEIQNDF